MALTRLRGDRGQAMTETMLLTWILLVFIAAMYQLFLLNHAIFASVSTVHQKIFKAAFDRNCWDGSQRKCLYSTDDQGNAARVVWNTQTVPEVKVPVVGMFRQVLPSDLRIYSNVRRLDRDCPRQPCKRTKMGSGTYEPAISSLGNAVGGAVDTNYWSSIFDDILGALIGIANSGD